MVFADDTQIYQSVPVSRLQKRLAKMKHKVNFISDYAVKNGFTSNIRKSKILILGSNAYVNQINLKNLSITVYNVELLYVSKERNLGVIMQSNLSWSRHIYHASLHTLKVMCHTDVVAPIVTNRFPYFRRTSSFFDSKQSGLLLS